jgi:hypothetical protein
MPYCFLYSHVNTEKDSNKLLKDNLWRMTPKVADFSDKIDSMQINIKGVQIDVRAHSSAIEAIQKQLSTQKAASP